jgi:hypothetical protein
MSKYNRHQSVVSRNTDEYVSEDHWLKQFEKSLEKGAVQPKSQQSLFDQINSVMNGATPKYPSVQAAVDDMMQRSGLSNYLKISKEQEGGKTKTAQDHGGNLFDRLLDQIKKFVAVREWYNVGHAMGKLEKAEGNPAGSALDAIMSFKYFHDPDLKAVRVPMANWGDFTLGYCAGHGSPPEQTKRQIEHINRMMTMSGTAKKASTDQNNVMEKQVPVEPKMPVVMQKNPQILQTLENYIRSTRGNLPIPAIIDKIRSIHRGDVSEEKFWDDDDLIRLVSKLNLEAKTTNPANYENYHNLASGDHDNAESDVDSSNTDAFNALMPAKL